MAILPHPSPLSGADYSAAELSLDNSTLIVLDQRRLPHEEHYELVRDWRTAVRAIAEMWVRGAPALGVSAAYAMVLAAQVARADYVAGMEEAAGGLIEARPTAVNLSWAVQRCLKLAREHSVLGAGTRVEQMAELARSIHREDVEANRRIGAIGAEMVPDGARILTHCNAGALATGGFGTALGVIRAARAAGKRVQVFADETRPYLQGSRLTAWELSREGIDVTVVADVAAGYLFSQGLVDLVIVGSDRIAANGDVANKIGTYTLACLCRAHQRPFYVAAPLSTLDLATGGGDQIVIEQRDEREVTHWGGHALTPTGVPVRNPAFDVTPAPLVTAIFTERGRVAPVTAEGLERLARVASR